MKTNNQNKISKNDRQRILYTIKGLFDRERSDQSYRLEKCLEELHQMLLERFGSIPCSGDEPYEPNRVVFDHFISCEDETVIEMLQMLFSCRNYTLGNHGVQAVNSILREIDYDVEFTEFFERAGDDVPHYNGRRSIVIERPKSIKRDGSYTDGLVQECLYIVADERFRKSNEEFRQALSRYKQRDFAGSITNCGQALESALKSVCDHKGWSYNDSDTTSKLLETCVANHLFTQTFYRSIVENVATIRNKLSDAHGRHGQSAVIDALHAEHAIDLTAANIKFLARL